MLLDDRRMKVREIAEATSMPLPEIEERFLIHGAWSLITRDLPVGISVSTSLLHARASLSPLAIAHYGRCHCTVR
jgi:hypothetical protein